MTVYVTQDDGRMDLSDAARFGRIVPVFTDDVYPDTVDDDMPRIVNYARCVLAKFNPGTDYLALVGSPLYVAVCSFVLGAAHESMRVLRYDRVERAYYDCLVNYRSIEEQSDGRCGQLVS